MYIKGGWGGGGLSHRGSGSHWLLNRTATVIHVSNCPSACPYNWVGKYLFSQSLQYLCNICHPCLQPPLRLSTELGWEIFLYFLQYLLHVHFFLHTAIFPLWLSQCCKLMGILYFVHFYIILCRNIWAGLQTLWLFCFSFPYNIQIHIPGGTNFQFRKFLCGTLNGILKPSQTRERYFRRPINFYGPISIQPGGNKN